MAVGGDARRSYDRRVFDDAGSGTELQRAPGMGALTPRELEVLEMISAGLTNAEAAKRLDLSVHGIKFHLTEIYRRLGVSNRTEAAVSYLRLTGETADPDRGLPAD
jgi:two-component system nitrate/nitrite response regulator NarL